MNTLGRQYQAAGGGKISTDWAVPLPQLMTLLNDSKDRLDDVGLADVERATYGHFGNGHPHQNFIAEDNKMRIRIEAIVHESCRQAIAAGGTFSAEHGVGKIKRNLFYELTDSSIITATQLLKQACDPKRLLSPGNLIHSGQVEPGVHPPIRELV